jgi:hypothetical protein
MSKRPSEYVSIRLDKELKAKLQKGARTEHRTLSNYCRLLLEYAYAASKPVVIVEEDEPDPEHWAYPG